ncbi:MAG: AMIN domain-containing protein [candidate division Zixibacteria bacterium]|nr:AMIN domain-containing protein [candidate division Zixibacteria bacterium]
MNKVYCIIAALILLAASSALASSRVTNIELSFQNGQTVARLDVDGTVRFSHQTEVAKDGKPFRVIVDILKARHYLGAKKFLSLPPCPVRGIRTSQYAVQPEEVVRVVFDMDKETAYQVESDQNSVTVLFPDKTGRSFAPWSTSVVVADLARKTNQAKVAPKVATKPVAPTAIPSTQAKTTAELNAEIDKDRLAALGSIDTPPATDKPEPPKAVKPVTPKASFTDKDKWANLYEKPAPKKQTPTPVTVASAADQTKPVVKPADKSEAGPVVASVQTKAPAPKKTVPSPKAEPRKTPKPKTADEPVLKTSGTVAKVDRARDKTEGTVKPPDVPEKTVVQDAESKKSTKKSDDGAKLATASDKSKKSTSRFRRTPAQSRKIKGTMVAEFPKRLIVKYKARGYRDPFETLINEARVSNDPVEQKVPNVEGLRLVGIIESEGGKNRALLEDANGYGYILQGGDRVKKGYVLRIESDRVYFQIFEYGWSRTMALHIED